ncbi:F0F1 ATP synthase subunit gamma [Azospirillum sp. B4]|uniref:F0F1 ATP synthase subunit gamma n=1 Tax=Azospirillum sp. B4 TaxID=95605 RepID=UPI00034A3B1B|nr:F0F1 ATP synthase subunit gamma [Azospirillum sp. B4]
MTERLADLNARIDGIRQLGAVVRAMRGMAAARAQQARGQLASVDAYAATLAGAIGQALLLAGDDTRPAPAGPATRRALVVFCAEQGFAGPFSARLLDAADLHDPLVDLFLVGSRGRMLARERGLRVIWSDAMPAQSQGIPKLAERICQALYSRMATGDVGRLEALHGHSALGQPMTVERLALFPLDPAAFPRAGRRMPPLLNLPASALLADLATDYVHAQLCRAALHAFAAENEARMQAMATAGGQIDRQLGALQATQRILRQDEITAEIIELAAGETASRAGA